MFTPSENLPNLNKDIKRRVLTNKAHLFKVILCKTQYAVVLIPYFMHLACRCRL